MKKIPILLIIGFLIAPIIVFGQKKVKISNNKKSVITAVESKSDKLVEMSDQIWSFEETAFHETRSAAVS